MNVQTYGINHVALEVTDIAGAVNFYTDVFGLKLRHQDEDHAFLYVGQHQFLALTRVEKMPPNHDGHFGLIVRDRDQLEAVRQKVSRDYGLSLIEGFDCDFRDPFGNRIQVADLHDESLVWLLPYQEVQRAGVVFSDAAIPDAPSNWQP
ncbi:MAG: VOC family protein [Opitutales bacterium]